jgi:hypothetical protein
MAASCSVGAKLQFTVKTPILVIFCGNIYRYQRSSEHLLFLLGRQYSRRYARLKFPRKPYIMSGSEGALTFCASVDCSSLGLNGFNIVYSSIGWLGQVRLGQHMIIQLLVAFSHLRAFTVYSSIGRLG